MTGKEDEQPRNLKEKLEGKETDSRTRETKQETERNTQKETGKKKRKRVAEENRETPKTVMTHIPSNYNDVTHSLNGSKQSKIKEKPRFKSKKKAKLRLSQANNIKNYFSSIGTRNIDRAKGGDQESEGESPIMSDFKIKFSST